MKPRVLTAGLPILLVILTVLPGLPWMFFPSQTSSLHNTSQRISHLHLGSLHANRPFDYILIILMENKNFSQIDGSSSAPYLNQLAHNYSLATRYSACDHPSLPNYMCLTGGNNYFSSQDCNPSGSCTTSNSSIVDRVEDAGLTWRVYMEDMPFPCDMISSGNYTVFTNPFVFYAKIASNSTRCATHVVPANSGGKGLPDDNLVNALGSTATASNYMWLTPNLCDNMHNCSISRGDGYLSKLIPLILNSNVFRTQKAALFITFDEGYGRYPTDYLYTIWAGPAVKTHGQSSIEYSHYSLLSTIEATWGLQPLTAKDAGSPPMTEFFRPPPTSPPTLAPLTVNLAFSPANPDTGQMVNFSGSAIGGTQPYVYELSFGDGNRRTGQTIGYVYRVTGNYTAQLTVVDASGQTATASQAISVDKDPSPAGPCQGCANTIFPKTLGLMISCAIGVALPLVGSVIISGRRRETVRNLSGNNRNLLAGTTQVRPPICFSPEFP